MKKIILVASLVILFLIGAILTHTSDARKLGYIKAKVIVANAQASSSPLPSSNPCYSSLDDSFLKVDYDPTAKKEIKKDCLVVFGSKYADLEHLGFQDLILWGSGQGCGSCHDQRVFVVSGQTGLVIFSKDSDDPLIGIIKDRAGQELTITEPLRRQSEPMCCPSNGVKTTYNFSKDSGTLFAVDEQPYKY